MNTNANTSTRGIILAGGAGSRLHPATLGISKQLIPIYNKPMIYYPLSCLMLAGIRNVLIISTPHDQESFVRLFGDGSRLGLNISYAVQERPEGLAQSFIIGKDFIGSDPVALALGDNIYYGHGISRQFREAAARSSGATVFAYEVRDPSRYGVVEFNSKGEVSNIVEKPEKPTSSWAVTGLYFYDNEVVSIAKDLKPSARGELEITDVNLVYLKNNNILAEKLGRGVAWFDTGTYDSLLQASMFVQSIEERQGLMVSCLEEIAYNKGFINAAKLEEVAVAMKKTPYGQYLLKILDDSRGLENSEELEAI